MASLGVLFAIPTSTSKRLLEAESGDEVLEIVEEIEEEIDGEYVAQTDKAWDAIHRALSDGTLDDDGGTYPLSHAILGGKRIDAGDDYTVVMVSKKEVPDVAEALAEIDIVEFKRRYDTVVPNDYAPEYGDEDREYTWTNFKDLAAFYARAAKAGRAVVFAVDQ